MLDEWGYFESGHMGHKELLTPNIDRFASEGMRFTNAYAGAPVCGPTRCALLTGLHAGHMSMRTNNGHSPIRAEEPTLASVLKENGYSTGGFGKWGIGGRGTSGVPEKNGFDVFFGFYDQVHAHTFYPQYLIRNSSEVPLAGNSGTSFYEGKTHAQDEIFKESIQFVRDNRDHPFSAIFLGRHLTAYGASTTTTHPGSFLKTNLGPLVSAQRTTPRSTLHLCIWSIAN